MRQFNDSWTIKEAGILNSHYRELLEAEETFLLDIVFDSPGMYLDEMKGIFEELTGKTVHIATLCREVTRLGLTRQSVGSIVLQRSEIGELVFKMKIELMDPLFFVSWMKQDVTRAIPL